ncbi:MAG TPA: hypothetical protein VH298_09050 [Jatrophihabitans sp.]|jgi:hypothetical protein|nr:hypothetical protein [Jatrophihabitans sp.]
MLSAMILFIGGLVGLMGGEAWATPTCSIPVGYECSYSTTGSTVHVGNEGSGIMDLYVCDTKADGDSAYAWYNIGSSTHQPTDRQETTGGNGTCHAPILISTSQITTEACRDIPSNPDNCSGWIHMVRS